MCMYPFPLTCQLQTTQLGVISKPTEGALSATAYVAFKAFK